MTTAVRERPILFSGEMVKAILAGRKTQTRRIPTFANSDLSRFWWNLLEWDESKVPEDAMHTFPDDGYLHVATRPNPNDPQTVGCWTRSRVGPIWQPGDRLWVRESWAIDETKSQEEFNRSELILYRADGERTGVKWHPSIHMPRWASRITLEITDVRVQRLNEISEEDARAEGVVGWRGDRELGCKCGACCLEDFVDLWNSINGKSHPWASNPWVFAISFKVLRREE